MWGAFLAAQWPKQLGFVMGVLHTIREYFKYALHALWAHLPYVLHSVWRFMGSVQLVTAAIHILILAAISAGLILSLGFFPTSRPVVQVLCMLFGIAAATNYIFSWGNLYYDLMCFGFCMALLGTLQTYLIQGDQSSEVWLIYRIFDFIGWDGGLYKYSSSILESRQRRRRNKKYEQRIVYAQTPEEVAEEAAQFKRLTERCEKARILAYHLYPVVEAPGRNPENARRANTAGQIATVVSASGRKNTTTPNSFLEPDYEPEPRADTFRDSDLNKRSARGLLQWLAREINESEGFVVPVKWTQDKKTGKIECHNGYNHMVRSIRHAYWLRNANVIKESPHYRRLFHK